jgi:hypothetical protein
MIVGAGEAGHTQAAIRSLSYQNNNANFEGVHEAALTKLNPGNMTGTGGKREIINRHEQRYGSTNHTGLLNLPRAQKNNIKQTYLQEAIKMKD